VGFSWLGTTFWTYGPIHSVEAVPAMFSEARAAKWARFADVTQNDLTSWRRKELKRRRRERGGTMPWYFALELRFFLWYEDTTPVHAIIDSRRWDRAPAPGPVPGWLRRVASDLRLASAAPRFQRMVISLLFAVVYVSNTEYMVGINLDEEANSWGFGQIFSMVAAVPFVASLVEFALRLGIRDR